MKSLDNKEIHQLLGMATRIQQKEISERIDECLDIARKQFPLDDTLRPYEKPTVTFDLKGRVAGEAWRTEIRLNSHLLHEFYDRMIAEVLPHEVAHCIVTQKYGWDSNIRSHGHEWAAVMRAFNLPPKRTHDMPTKPAGVHQRLTAGCVSCGKEYQVTKRRANKIFNYRCGNCGSPLVMI